jgi:hypothetical protein
MADDRWAMYDYFSDKGAHSAEWFRIAKEFLKTAFAGGRREAMCSCGRCCNRKMLSEYEMSGHIAKKGFMPDYLVWHQHGEVQPPTATESDGNDDEDRLDDMIADIGMEYDLEISIHRRRCRISTGSLPPQKKKCTMAPL